MISAILFKKIIPRLHPDLIDVQIRFDEIPGFGQAARIRSGRAVTELVTAAMRQGESSLALADTGGFG